MMAGPLHEGARHVPAPRRRRPLARPARPRERAQPAHPRLPDGRKTLPKQRPAYIVFGEETEAIDYAVGAGGLWASVPGALAWLES